MAVGCSDLAKAINSTDNSSCCTPTQLENVQGCCYLRHLFVCVCLYQKSLLFSKTYLKSDNSDKTFEFGFICVVFKLSLET